MVEPQRVRLGNLPEQRRAHPIDSITVTKEVQRQSLVVESFTGSYRGLYGVTLTGCDDPSHNGARELPAQPTIDRDDNAMFVRAISAWFVNGRNSLGCTSSGRFAAME